MAPIDEPDWYLQEWAALKGKKQTHLVSEAGWVKNAANRIWHGKQPYRRDILNRVARWLDVQPYELLMPPQEAMSLRKLRESAAEIVASTTNLADTPPDHFLPKPLTSRPRRRTGTVG